MADDASPFEDSYYATLTPSVPEPPFQAPEEQERVWGRVWGSLDEVGPLRTVLVRSPGTEWERVRADCWNERAKALVDPDGMWYWLSKDPPDMERVRAQHGGLVAALEAEGVEVVHVAGDAPAHLSRPIYTRDPLLTVPGGAVIGRMAPAMRRGEERLVTQAVAALGMPILRTITGTGLVDLNGLPWWFLDRLRELGIETIPVPAEEAWAINSLALAPGRVLMADGHPRTVKRLEGRRVEVVTIPYEEIQKGGGGVHCSTMELAREPAD
jgi:N-dimethylarginine dimethylaminohydrolase